MMTFAALADPTRFHIVEMLAANGRMPVSQIGKQFTISPPAVSQHLKVLKAARLVHVEVSAQQRIYMLNPDGIAEIEQWITKMRRMWEARFDALDALLLEEHVKITKPKRKKP
ncbi:MAG: Bacterial regulatory protein ArsR family [Rickettsiales bacterium]|jgi:DNA-binding transcriptional ArsR family regulator|nr:Bacterial regulatory protein ArsR family [Rickettsiales bacterium]